MFSCEFYEISKHTFFVEHLWVTASDPFYFSLISLLCPINIYWTFKNISGGYKNFMHKFVSWALTLKCKNDFFHLPAITVLTSSRVLFLNPLFSQK